MATLSELLSASASFIITNKAKDFHVHDCEIVVRKPNGDLVKTREAIFEFVGNSSGKPSYVLIINE